MQGESLIIAIYSFLLGRTWPAGLHKGALKMKRLSGSFPLYFAYFAVVLEYNLDLVVDSITAHTWFFSDLVVIEILELLERRRADLCMEETKQVQY